MRTLTLLLVFVIASCGGAHLSGPEAVIRPPSSMREDFMAQQEITFSPENGEANSFNAILQKRGNTLTLLALTPFGTRAFSIEQSGDDVRSESYVVQPLPVDARVVIADVDRSLFPYFPSPPANDTSRETRFGDVQVSERWTEGRLRERRFDETDTQSPDAIRIEYEYGDAARRLPTQVRLTNPRMHYSLTVVTLEETAL